MAQKKEKKESAEEKDVALSTQNQEVAKEPVDDLPGENAEENRDEQINKIGDDVPTIVNPLTTAVLKAAIVYLAGRLLERPDFEDFKGFFPSLF